MPASALEELLEKIGELPTFDAICPLNPNSRTCVGETPLHVAAVWGDVDAIKLLIHSGADVNARGDHGYTPLYEAVEQRKVDAVRALLMAGANPEITNDNGSTPRALAAAFNDLEIMQALGPEF